MVNKKTKQPEPRSRNRWFGAITIIVILLLVTTIISGCASLFMPEIDNGNVALIPINGIISYGDDTYTMSVTDAGTIRKFIEDAENNDDIKAIVLEINSGGGTPVASAEIAEAVNSAKKPTVAWIKEMGASGAYWVASSSDIIIAHEMSATGSIGVIGSYLEFANFLDDHNITYNRQVSGQYKDMGSPLKEMTESEKIINQERLDKIHDIFVKNVAENRNMSLVEVSKLATGQVYLGIEAKENGLVDKLGGEAEVITTLNDLIEEDVDFVRYQKEESLLESLSHLSSNFGFELGSGIAKGMTSQKTQSLI